MPPVLTVTVTTGRWYVAWSHGTQNDVSRPPENASRMGFEPWFVFVMAGLSASEGCAQALEQSALSAGGIAGDEDGVVAGERADDFGPAGLVDGERDALRGAGRRAHDRQRGSGATAALDEGAHALEVARRQGILDFRQKVAVSSLRDAEVAKIAAHARLRRLEALPAQQPDELRLPAHGRLAQDADERSPPQRLVVEIGGHLEPGKSHVRIKSRGMCINMRTLSS